MICHNESSRHHRNGLGHADGPCHRGRLEAASRRRIRHCPHHSLRCLHFPHHHLRRGERLSSRRFRAGSDPTRGAGRNTQFALGACCRAWKACRARLPPSSISIASASISAAAKDRSISTPTPPPPSAAWDEARLRPSTAVKWAEVAKRTDERHARTGAGAQHAPVASGPADRRTAARRSTA